MTVSVKDKTPRWVLSAADAVTRTYAMGSAWGRPGPDFLVIGTKRGGTTSMFNYMVMHPAVLALFPQVRGKKSTNFFFADTNRSEAWYRSHFATEAYRSRLSRQIGCRAVSGEASPYYIWDPRIAPLVHKVAPAVKAIALLRDPVERAYSHYQERTQNGVEPLSFEDALAAEDKRLDGELDRMMADPGYHSTAHDWYSYRSRGDYLPQLQAWTNVFPREQLLVLRSEDMYEDVQGVFVSVCEFLGVPYHQLPTTKAFNASHRKSPVPEAARRELAKYFETRNAAVEKYLGRTLGWTRPQDL